MATISGVTIQPVLSSITDPDRVILDVAREAAEIADTSGGTGTGAWTARLYLWPGEPNPPSWLAFLRDGFGAAVQVPDSNRSKAVVVVTIQWRRRARLFAISFGDGRHQLRRPVLDLDAARKVQLNAIYEGDSGTTALEVAPRLRDVEYVQRGETTMRTRRQAGRNADFDQFEFEADVDELVGVTGIPFDQKAFGARISGKTSLRLARTVSFAQLADVCRNIARYEARDYYKRRFEFVDRIAEVTTPAVVEDLDEALVALFRGTGVAGFEFAPPEIVDFDRLASLKVEGPATSVSLPSTASASEIVAICRSSGASFASPDELLEWRVAGIGTDDDVVASWTVRECIEGQVDLRGEPFLLSGGRYSAVSAGYLAQIDAQLALLPSSSVKLPASTAGEAEGTYNERAVATSQSYFCLDKKTVVVATRTSPIEVCDVLTTSGQLVHVKRKFSSATLSHLFSQGETSGVLLVDSAEFRAAVRQKLKNAPDTFAALFDDALFRAGNLEVVYAIAGDWKGGGLADRLPFFSKINLLRRAQSLRRMGYRVTYSAIDAR